MRLFTKGILLAVPLMALSGCQSSPLTSWLFKRPDRNAAQIMRSEGLHSLAEGRDALQEGRPAAAVVPLRIALLDPTTRPQASNALGVAYAQMGRDDIAEQYFKAAIEADPGDTRYVANLLRLQHAVLARRTQADASRLAVQSGGEVTRGKGFIANIPEARSDAPVVASKIERRSRGEVFIASANAPSAPSAVVAYSAQPLSNKATAKGPVAVPSKQVIENPFGAQTQLPSVSKDRP